MSDLTSKERPVFVPAVRTPKLPYLCAGAECVTCKRPVYGDWGLVPDECDTCDAERRARYYRECAQWADAKIDRLTARNVELVKAHTSTLANLVAAVSLLERSPKTAAPSAKMFDQMLADYNRAIDSARAALEGVKP